ncbi:MAG: preprotein translocase subunit SecG, partial [Planctomycetota bacterium]
MVALLTILFLVISILIVIAVLIQPHEEEGMGGIFGSSGPESFFGGKGNITMIKITTILGILYFVIALSIHKINASRYGKEKEKTASQQQSPAKKIPES